MRDIERMAWEADQLGMSYGQYVALCENSAPGALEDELRRRRKKMPDYKDFLKQKAKRNAQKNARKSERKSERRAPKPFKIKPEHVTVEHVRCCPVCGTKFKTTDHARKYCGMKCALKAHNEQHKEYKARARRKAERAGC